MPFGPFFSGFLRFAGPPRLLLRHYKHRYSQSEFDTLGSWPGLASPYHRVAICTSLLRT